jgi:hypothetical protein
MSHDVNWENQMDMPAGTGGFGMLRFRSDAKCKEKVDGPKNVLSVSLPDWFLYSIRGNLYFDNSA